jgi:hypothetical protein
MWQVWDALAGLTTLKHHRHRCSSLAALTKNERRERWEKRINRGSRCVFKDWKVGNSIAYIPLIL